MPKKSTAKYIAPKIIKILIPKLLAKDAERTNDFHSRYKNFFIILLGLHYAISNSFSENVTPDKNIKKN